MVHDDAGGELHVERPQAQRPLGGDADQAERLRQQLVERFAAAGPPAEPGCRLFQLVVGELVVLLLPAADGRDEQGPAGEPPLPRRAGYWAQAVGGIEPEPARNVLRPVLGLGPGKVMLMRSATVLTGLSCAGAGIFLG